MTLINFSLKCLRFNVLAIAAAAMIALSPAALAGQREIYTSFGSRLAVGGYDTVAYFSEGAPVKGSKDYVLNYKGVKWRFSSQENLETFESDPDSFTPRYGGFCAWAVAMGIPVPGDPKIWTIYEDRLYLNVNKSTQEIWLKDVPGFVANADANWPGIVAE